MLKSASAASAVISVNQGQLALVLETVVATVLFIGVVAAITIVTARFFNRHLVRRNRALETQLETLERRVAELENIGVLPPGTPFTEEEHRVARPGFWVWTLIGIVAGAIVGYVVLQQIPPGPIYRAALLWTHGDKRWFQGLIWVGSGLVVLAVFMVLGGGTKRVKVMVKTAAPTTRLRVSGSGSGRVTP
jgi:hypothetical protein